jgi:hypothetical protein
MPVPPVEMSWEDKRKQLASKAPLWLGRSLGLPVDAAGYVLWLERRILELEEKVANLQPPHLAKVEKRDI